MQIFGTGNEAVRALSGVFGVLALIPAWYVGRRLDERRARAGLQQPGVRPIAWTLTLLLAASPFAIRYATEARMYALVILLVFVGYLALARVLERPSWGRLLGLAVVTSLLLYTHYWSFALLGRRRRLAVDDGGARRGRAASPGGVGDRRDRRRHALLPPVALRSSATRPRTPVLPGAAW